MIFAADIVSDCIADRMVSCLIIHIQHGLELNIHLLQLRPGGVILHDHELIAAESGEKTILSEYSCQVRSKGLNKHITLFMTICIVDLFQIVQVEHHDTYIQGVVCILKLLQLLFQGFFIVDTCYVKAGTSDHISDIIP